jgi:serine/threonine protein kinase/Tfp pilus assembly protein PilF
MDMEEAPEPPSSPNAGVEKKSDSPADAGSTLLGPIIGPDGCKIPWRASGDASKSPDGEDGQRDQMEDAQRPPSRPPTQLPGMEADSLERQSTLVGPIVAPDRLSTCGPWLDSPAFPVVSGYDIEGVLGRGGMGVVYKAVQRKLMRPVALKMIQRDLNVDPTQLERFRVEAQAVAQLRHPNIVQIFDVGDVGGVPYFSLEMLEGGSLADQLAGASMPAGRAADLATTLARAVSAVHEVGIIHRDLKPANVLFDGYGTPKVTDFGLAKRLETDDKQTQTGQIMGTPSYMAPEQAQGLVAKIGPAADIYALGAVLYEMLTGRPPFKGSNVMETLSQVVSDEPVAPSRLQPRVPRDLETICLKCLSKPPERRYACANDLADDLERFRAGEPILARRTSMRERSVRWMRRRPAMTALISLLLILATTSAGLVGWYLNYMRQQTRFRENRIAEWRFKALDRLDKALQKRSSGNLDDARLDLSTLKTEILGEPAEIQADTQLAEYIRRTDIELRDVQQRLADAASRDAVQKQFARFTRLRDDALMYDGIVAASLPLESSGETDAGADSGSTDGVASAGFNRRVAPLERVRETARAAVDVFPIEIAEQHGATGSLPSSLLPSQQAQIEADRYLMLIVLSEAVSVPLGREDPLRQAGEALRILDRAAALRGSTPAYFLVRAGCLERLGKQAEARAQREQAARLTPTDDFDHLLLGRERYMRGDWDAARQFFDRPSKSQRTSFWARCWLAIACLNSDPPRAAEAKSELTACVLQHPTYAWLYLLRGFAYGQMAVAAGAARMAPGRTALAAESEARFNDAEADFHTALDRGLDGVFRYALLTNRGVMRFRRKQLEAAADDFRQAIGLEPKRYNAYASLAVVLRGLGRRVEAVEALGKAIALEPGRPELYRGRALALERADLPTAETQQALSDLEEASRRGPPRSRNTAEDRVRRGQLLFRLGRYQEALADAEAAIAVVPRLPSAHLVRVSALLELGRYDEMIESCDAALARGSASAELYRVRGLVHDRRGEYAAAVDDYTHALSMRPENAAEVHRNRGWSHLYVGAPALAERDFEAVLKHDPADPDGRGGRAAARVRLGYFREAVTDAEVSINRAGTSPRLLLNAAEIYAQASSRASAEVTRRGPAASREAQGYRVRATKLLELSLDQIPAAQRSAFWRDIVKKDSLLTSLLLELRIRQRLRSSPSTLF